VSCVDSQELKRLPPRVIVGLGNPGPEYEWTRHSIGQHIVKALAERHQFSFHSEKGVEAQVAKGMIGEQPVVLGLPKVYMNESGRSVNRLLRFVGVEAKDLMVVVDDIETPWGQMKIAFAGGTRGHNGLRSIQGPLGTMAFSQMRIGVGRPGSGSVADYVLRRFAAEEMSELPSIMERALVMIEEWLTEKAAQSEGERSERKERPS
jgi:peptidyl-tRNA hydrolase, PTH1 family